MVPLQVPLASTVWPVRLRLVAATLLKPPVPLAGEFDAIGPLTLSVPKLIPVSVAVLPTAQIAYGGSLTPGKPRPRDVTTEHVTSAAGWLPVAG